MFKSVHPTTDKAGPLNSDAVNSGMNSENVALKDNLYTRCRQCGFICHLTRDVKHSNGSQAGVGEIRAETQVNGAVTAAATTLTVDSTTGFITPATGSITAFASNSTGTQVTSAAHGLKGGKVTITSTTNYNGTFFIQDVFTNTFVIPIAFVADDATGTWTVPEYIYIHDVGTYATSGDVSSTYTAATGEPRVDKILYTGVTSTTFTGCKSESRSAGMHAHDDNMYVKGRSGVSGCPRCGSYLYA